MLFRKTMEPRCIYCQRGSSLDNGEVICVKKGIVSEEFHCRSFQYDPLKRQPVMPPLPDFGKLNDEDFML